VHDAGTGMAGSSQRLVSVPLCNQWREYFPCQAILEQTRQLTSLPVAVITHGSLLYLPEVRRDLLAADAVLPTLDAGYAGLYRRIHPPGP
jgi:wyosine [tRNA(Phe)-imidazoG37] synthetase (radical SAM superfamily)